MKVIKARDLIKISDGVFLWYETPPYTLMYGFEDKTVQFTVENELEIDLFIKTLKELRKRVVKPKPWYKFLCWNK
jgi:hypothetical protein